MSKTIGELLEAVNSQPHGIVIPERRATDDLITPDSLMQAARNHVAKHAPHLSGTRWHMAIGETLSNPQFLKSLTT